MNKKQRQKKKQLKRLEKNILKGKIDVSLLDEQIFEIPLIKQSILEIKVPKKKTKIRKHQLSKLKKSSSFDLIEENDNQLSFSRKKQRKKKRKQKKTKSYKVKQGAKVPTSKDEIDAKHPELSTDSVANSPLIAIQEVRSLCQYYSNDFIAGLNTNFLLRYFDATITRLGEDTVGNALLSMDDSYIESVKSIIFESKQEVSNQKTYAFISMIVSLAGNEDDYWHIQDIVDDNLGQEYE